MSAGAAETPRSIRRILLPGLVLAALSVLPQPAAAAPIRTARHRNLVRVAIPRGGWAYWDRYYLRALGNQRLRVNGPNALQVLRPDADGRLPDIPMVWYLQWRRSLRPATFARFHPELTRWLIRDQISRLPETPIPSGPITPGGVNPPPPIGPQVPEPSSLLIASILTGATVLWRRQRSAKSRDTARLLD